jgi:hypothetical protein
MRSKLLLVAAFGAGLVALSACGTTTVSGTATAPGAGAPAAPAQGAGAQISSVADLGSLVQHSASKKTSTHVTMNMTVSGGGTLTAEGDFKFAGTESAMHMGMTVPSAGDMDMILVDRVFYLKLPANLNTTGKPWVKIDLNGNDALSKSFGSTVNLAGQSDPTQIIEKFTSSGTITKVSHEDVDGQPTTHYAIAVDVRKLAQSLGAADAEKQALDTLNVSTLPLDVWVNSDGLPVKVVMHIAVANPQTGQAVQVNMTANYTHWGEPVDISAPPADEVGTLDGN